MYYQPTKHDEYRSAPKPGDYWHEQLCPKLVVLGVGPSSVTIADCVVHYEDGWSWIFEQVKSLPLEHFAQATRGLTCYRGVMLSAVEDWQSIYGEER